MNYYRRYVGDYLRDTSRLSVLEHGAYTLMLDYYYADESPLPAEKDELYLMVRAMTPADRKAVDKILRLYFTLEPDGYHQKRADHEIDVSKKARANGKGGGRPPSGSQTGTVTGSQTGNETGPGTKNETETETGSITGEGGGSVHPPTTNHLASNHQPPNLQPPDSKSTPFAPSDFSLEAGKAAKPDRPNGRHHPLAAGPIVIAIPLVGDAEYPVHQALADELERNYPAVDVLQTLREIRAWNLTNPKRRKTREGLLRHVNEWFKKEQNR
jgi:uncharacterized protein YdaU (DUF1376 family)